MAEFAFCDFDPLLCSKMPGRGWGNRQFGLQAAAFKFAVK
jgi:hypothetical protein